MNRKGWVISSICLSMWLGSGLSPQADVKLSWLFGNNMVLQRDMPVRIWGWADNDEKVVVKICNQRRAASVSKGKWLVTLDPMKAGGPYVLDIIGKNKLQFSNVMIGEVWVCGGQSNMEWPLRLAKDAEKHIANCTNPNIRLFNHPHTKSDVMLETVKGSWSLSAPVVTQHFSAVAYFFGRDLQKALNVPIGLINSSVSGSPAESWVPEDVLAANPALRPALDRYPKHLEDYSKAVAAYPAQVKKAKESGLPTPGEPPPPFKPAELYNGMIAPLVNYTIRGVIWYQGESNIDWPQEYRKLFPTLIRSWRNNWRQGDFPFLAVQLASMAKISSQPMESRVAELREAQLLATRLLPNVALVVTTDVGDDRDVHPIRKEPVGVRLALAARATVYGENIEYSGPIYKYMEIRGDKIICHFDHIGKGLEARDGPLIGFLIAGEDNKFVWADAVIEGDTIVVSAKSVPKPINVRFGWAHYAVTNLWNKDGLPASPFRTDRADSDMTF